MLSDAKFLDSLLNFDKDNIPDKVIETIRTDYLTNPDFDPEKIKKVSTACEGLCRWVIAMSEYDEIAKIVAPKKRALAEAEAAYDKAMELLNFKREQLRQVQVHGALHIAILKYSIGFPTQIRYTYIHISNSILKLYKLL